MVDTPTVKHVGVQIVDITTGLPWAGAKAKLIGEAGGNMSNEDRTWTSSLSDTVHTFRLPLQNGSFTIEVVDSDMFAYSEFKFEVVQDGDGFKLESANNASSPDGTIDNNTITVYAYPKVMFRYSINYNTDTNCDNALKGFRLSINDSDNNPASVKGQNPWDLKHGNQKKALGIATGSYIVSEVRRSDDATVSDLSPVKITVKRNDNGTPEIHNDSKGWICWDRIIDVIYQYK